MAVSDDAPAFDPGVHRDRGYRAKLIATGSLLPLSARPTLRMDARAHRVAKRHMEAGDYGGKVLSTGPGYYELAVWHIRALELRERRVAEFNRFLKRVWPPPNAVWHEMTRRMAIEHAPTLRALATR